MNRLTLTPLRTFCWIVFLLRFYIQDKSWFLYMFSCFLQFAVLFTNILHLRKLFVTFAVTSYYPYTEDLDRTVRSMLIGGLRGYLIKFQFFVSNDYISRWHLLIWNLQEKKTIIHVHVFLFISSKMFICEVFKSADFM